MTDRDPLLEEYTQPSVVPAGCFTLCLFLCLLGVVAGIIGFLRSLF